MSNPSETVPDAEPEAAAAAIPAAPASRNHTEVGYVFAAIGALLFSTKGIAIKLAYAEPIDATILLALRMTLAVPVYLAIGAIVVRSDRVHGKPAPAATTVAKAALVGALGYWVASYLDFAGLEHISAQFERLILFTYPLFVVVFGALFFGQPMRLKAVAAIGLSYVGLAVIFLDKAGVPGSHIALGAALVLASAVAFAFYQLIAKDMHRHERRRRWCLRSISGDPAPLRHRRRQPARVGDFRFSGNRCDHPAIVFLERGPASHIGPGQRDHRHAFAGHDHRAGRRDPG
jgi:hypothetical protein